jgi:Uri superfamily endonuclease
MFHRELISMNGQLKNRVLRHLKSLEMKKIPWQTDVL